MISPAKIYVASLAKALGNTAIRRAAVGLIVGLAVHFTGKALDVQSIDTLIVLFLPLATAWSATTPKIDTTEADKGGE